jgi:2-dehydropantoate 2-reductase
VRILVVGSGAMGTLFAGLLAWGGHNVWLLTRRAESVEVARRFGVRIWAGGVQRRVDLPVTMDAAEAAPADLVLMAVKSYDTQQASRDALPAMAETTVALTLQNGLGNVEAMSAVMGRSRVMAGVTAHGATLLGPVHVSHAGTGDTTMGEPDGGVTDRLRAVGAAMEQAGIAVQLAESLDSVLWGKVVVNAAINPITALLRLRNGRLLEGEETRRLMQEAALEAASVAAALGVELPYADPVQRVEAVCRLTSGNRSSMLQDIERGARTEVDQISGAIVRQGESIGVPVPVNRVLRDLVSALEPRKR